MMEEKKKNAAPDQNQSCQKRRNSMEFNTNCDLLEEKFTANSACSRRVGVSCEPPKQAAMKPFSPCGLPLAPDNAEQCHLCELREKGDDQLEEEERREASIRVNHRNFKRKTAAALICNHLFFLLILNAISSHLNTSVTSKLKLKASNEQTTRFGLPNIILADAIECTLDGDCGSRDKICHESKCICARDRPIEDQDRCLSLTLIGEPCMVSEQCLGNSLCIDGSCSCGSEAISFYNPSIKIFYCHPKRRLNEECNYDQQCPQNSYCSTNKYGCLCQNGFAASLVSPSLGVEWLECLPKLCSNSSACESEFHQCDDNKCKCIATHFDPTSGKCYRFGSTGGKSLDELQESANGTTTSVGDDNNFYSILKDLTENSDKMWLVLIILISMSIIVFVLIFILLRRHYLGYCWTASKKEYEPNNKNAPKNGYFNKNSINNKSFRKKNGDIEDDDDDALNGDDNDETAASDARSNLVTPVDKGKTSTNKNKQSTAATALKSAGVDNNHDYVKININEDNRNNSFNDSKQYYQHQLISPLKTSTSTPV